MVLKNLGEAHIPQCLNGLHIKYGPVKLICVPYGKQQRNKYSITYGNAISALSGFGHILKHLLQDQCIHQNMLSVSLPVF